MLIERGRTRCIQRVLRERGRQTERAERERRGIQRELRERGRQTERAERERQAYKES
jgi:hypothetical protein